MFHHLDDPNPPQLGDDFQKRVMRRIGSRRRRRHLALAASLALVATVVGAAGLYLRAGSRLDDVESVRVAGTVERGSDIAGPQTVLLVGNDARPDSGHPSEAEHGLTDTVLAVRFDPDSRTVSALAVPRDLAVEHPQTGELVRINGIAANSGLSTLVTIVEEQVGIQVDHVVSVGFDGFINMVDLIGGVEVQVAGPLRDELTGLDVPEAGCTTLNGTQALQLARARYLQVFDGTRWRTDPRGDFGRITRVEILMLSGLESLAEQHPDPLDANRLADAFVDNVVVSESLDRPTIAGLLNVARQMSTSDITYGAIPVEDLSLPNGAAVLRATPEASEVVDHFASGRLAETETPGGMGATDVPLPDGLPFVDLCR